MQSTPKMPLGIEPRRRSDGTLTFRVKVRLKGAPAQHATFTRLTDAKRWRTQTEAAIREGRHFRSAEATRHTLADAIDRYKKDVLPTKPKSRRNTELHLDWWSKKIGYLTLRDVTAPVIINLRDELSAGHYKHGKKRKRRSASTVIRYLAALSHVFTIAAKEWQWTDHNPLTLVRKPPAPRGRVRFLSDAERSDLLAACKASDSKYLYIIVVLALSTGMRSSEVRGLRWKQISLERGWIVLEETKNGHRRGIPLAGLALELMKEHAKVRNLKTDLVFPGSTGKRPIELGKAWSTAVKKAELVDFRFHDLRHSAASYLAMSGATSVELAAVLGHRSLQMVQRYAHIADGHTTAMVSKMNDKIFGGQTA